MALPVIGIFRNDPNRHEASPVATLAGFVRWRQSRRQLDWVIRL